MAILKSAKKALRQGLKRREGNLVYKDKIKTLLKEFKILVSQKRTKEAEDLLPKVHKALDKAAKVGVIKKNNASRKKSRLARQLNKTA